VVPERSPSRSPTDRSGRTGAAAYAAAGRDVVAAHPWLSLFPLVSALLSFGQARRAAETTVSVTFPLPSHVVDVWMFVQSGPVNTGAAGGLGAGDTLLLAVPVFLIGAVVDAAVATALLGAVTDALDGEAPAPLSAFGAHFPAVLGYTLLSAAVVWVLAPLVVVGPVVVLAFLVVFALQYLFFGTPFVVVAEDASLAAALRRSYAMAVAGGRYARFAVTFLLVGAVLSVPVSLLVGTGPVGAAVAAVLVAPVGALAVAATAAMVRDELDGRGTPAPAAAD